MSRHTRAFFRGMLVVTAASGLALTQPRLANGGAEKVTICHIPPGNPANAHTITVGAPAVPTHLAQHGDCLGACPCFVPPEEDPR
jgi:hypothetical protein